MGRLFLGIGMATAALALSPAASGQPDQASLGGGSDLRGGTVIQLAQGARVPPIHFVFADNPETDRVAVAFRAETAPGITITPERRRASLAQGEKVEIRFGITVARSLAPGRYRVTVQLVRSDIETSRGDVTNVPAVGTHFVVRVVGDTASVTVNARSAATGTPVEGTLVLSTILASGATLAVDRTGGSTLKARVGPGTYEGKFLLGDKAHASKRVRVRAGQSTEIVLRVKTVAFVVVAAKPVMEGEKLIVADLVASVHNELGPIEGPVTLRTRVFEDEREIDTVPLAELPTLPKGFSEGKETYRPTTGWRTGSSYRFEFELETPEFTLTASEKPTIKAPSPSTWSASLPIVAAASAAGALAFGVAAAALIARRRGRARL